VTGTNFEVRVSEAFPIPQPTGTDGGSGEGDGGRDAGGSTDSGDAGEVADGGTDPVADAGMDTSSDANGLPDPAGGADANDQSDKDAGSMAVDANRPDMPTADSGPAADGAGTTQPPTETPNKPNDPSCLGCNATDSGTTPEAIIATIAAAAMLRRRRSNYGSISE
ncbi:MAG: hypothetical protein AAB592_02690, partial [Patescibacteria group bacterium]